MYGRTYNAHRYSPLKQINKKNVARLIPVWTFQTGVLDGFECTPLVIDGIMYVTTPWNHAYAIDCKTGSQLWHYQKSLPENLALCCDAVNRGFAAWGDRLYMTTLDAHLVCLDRNTGEEIWDTAITVTGDDGKEVKDIYKMAYSATVAPLVDQGQGHHRASAAPSTASAASSTPTTPRPASGCGGSTPSPPPTTRPSTPRRPWRPGKASRG